MKTVKILALVVCITAAHMAHGQRYLEEAIPYRNTAVLRTVDGFVELAFTRRQYTGRAAPELVYHSYYRDSIYRTQGGYHGRPLHGRYLERYSDKSLKVLGSYSYGLRDGKWQYWDASGTLRKVSRWKEGKETGKFTVYNAQGQRQQRGYLRDGKFNGIVTTYHSGDSARRELRRYRAGQEIGLDQGSWLSWTYDKIRIWFL